MRSMFVSDFQYAGFIEIGCDPPCWIYFGHVISPLCLSCKPVVRSVDA